MNAPASTPDWSAALGKVPSGLFVITASDGGRETGFLASWVQQCSFDPPQLTFAVGRGRPVLDWLAPGTAVGVHVLAEGAKALVAHFGRGFAPGEAAFDGLTILREPGTAPRIAEALAWMDARITSLHDVGDHLLFVARVAGGAVQHEGRPTVHLRRDARRY